MTYMTYISPGGGPICVEIPDRSAMHIAESTVDSGIIVNFAPWIEEDASSAEEQLASNRSIRHAEIVETIRGCHVQLRFYDFRRRQWLRKPDSIGKTKK